MKLDHLAKSGKPNLTNPPELNLEKDNITSTREASHFCNYLEESRVGDVPKEIGTIFLDFRETTRFSTEGCVGQFVKLETDVCE